jgi:hypothetical protein
MKTFSPEFCRGLVLGLVAVCLLATPFGSRAEDAPFRTDGGDEKLKWFALKPGEFPPAGSGHYISGELIAVDHINRAGRLRIDRTDAQRRGDWDRPLPFVLLPYGSVSYHGAPAEMRHIPIGTHLHGWFYIDDVMAKELKAKIDTVDGVVCAEANFCRPIRLEDDFSYYQRIGKTWRLDSIDWEKMALTVTGIGPGKDQVDAKPTVFHVAEGTRIWKGNGTGDWSDLVEGKILTVNLTIATLKGPGRCTDIWLDEESRALATKRQREVHRQWIREHGLAAIIDEVDNAGSVVTATIFDGFDPKQIEDFPSNEAIAAAAKGPAFVPGPGLIDPISVTAAVAEDNLRTWDQINDRKAGTMLEIIKSEPGPGFSRYRIRFKPSLLLEGFRPKRIIRLWPAKWRVDDLPREEKMYY